MRRCTETESAIVALKAVVGFDHLSDTVFFFRKVQLTLVAELLPGNRSYIESLLRQANEFGCVAQQ